MQESRAEIIIIKKILKKIKFEVEIKLMRGYEKGGVNYQQDPVKWLIQKCNKFTKKARENARSINNETNIKFYGCYSIKKDN